MGGGGKVLYVYLVVCMQSKFIDFIDVRNKVNKEFEFD